MDRSRSMHDTQPKPTCGTDLGTKLEKKQGWTKETWRRIVERERSEMKLTSWDMNRDKWRQLISGPISQLREWN